MAGDKSSLRILTICPQFRPLIGGYERAAENLSAALAARGHRVVVLAERREPAWPALEQIDGYEVRRLSCSYRPHRHAMTSLLSYAAFLLRRGRAFDLWHVHQYGLHAALAVALGRLLRRPVVLKLPSSGDMGIERALGKGVVGKVLRFFHLQVNACLAVSAENRAEAIRFGISAQRVHLIPNGVDGRRFHPVTPAERSAARQSLGLDCQRLVLSVGRLSAEKNLLGLLDAWAAIAAPARAGTLLALVGDGPDWDAIQAKARQLSIAGSVHLAGQRSDVSLWYRAADVYVVPSFIEGLSNTMIEALASGVPVVSTRVSGSSVLMAPRRAGVVVDVGNSQQLAAAIAGLLNDEAKRIQLSRNARAMFEARFSLDTLSHRMVELYRQLVEMPRRGIV